jgi:hypothetical protein
MIHAISSPSGQVERTDRAPQAVAALLGFGRERLGGLAGGQPLRE